MNWLKKLNNKTLCKREGKFAILSNGYRFNSNLFYVGILLMVGLGVIVWAGMGWSLSDQVYFKCDQDTSCVNPFYKGIDCFEPECSLLSDKDKSRCVGDWCSEKFLPGGFVVGNPPSWLVKTFHIQVMFILMIVLIINHLLYNLNYKVKNEEDNN